MPGDTWIPMPPGGLLPWLARTGYYKRSLPEMDRLIARRGRERRAAAADARVLANIAQSPDGCWIWQGTLSRRGTPWVRVGGREYTAAYWIWRRIAHKKVPEGYGVKPTRCGNKLCVNPEHCTPVIRGALQHHAKEYTRE